MLTFPSTLGLSKGTSFIDFIFLMVLLYTPTWPGTHNVDQTDHKLIELFLSLPPCAEIKGRLYHGYFDLSFLDAEVICLLSLHLARPSPFLKYWWSLTGYCMSYDDQASNGVKVICIP